MKVYVVTDEFGQMCEGGSTEVLGVFARFDRAFEEVRKGYPEAKKTRQDGQWKWDVPVEYSCDYRLICIEAHKVE